MPNLGVESRSLSQGFVFYERLLQDGHKNLYESLMTRMENLQYEKNKGRLAKQLKVMSDAESNKELSLLSKVFNTTLNFETKDKNFYLELIQTLNKTLQLEDVYKRAINRLNHGYTQGSVAQFFPSYFTAVWKEEYDNGNAIGKEAKTIMKNKKGITFVEAVEEAWNNNIDEIIKKSINKMLNSEDLDKNDGNRSLQQLIEYMNTYHGNKLIESLRKVYKIDEICEKLKEQALIKGRRGKLGKDVNAKKIVNKRFYSDGGLSLEYFENFISNIVIDGITTNNANVTIGGSIHSGSTEMKADNIIVFNIDPNVVETIINNGESGTREKNMRLVESLGENLKNVNDGFIIYSSAKNYSINKNFSSHGFSGGTPTSLGTLKNIMPGDISVLIGAISNTIPGAIGAGMKEDLSQILAADVAYFLFDDVSTIGNLPTNSTQSLHIFDLDGVYVPLSYLLFELSSAIEEGEKDPSKVVRATITTPSGVLYEKDKDAPWTGEEWNKQRADALKNIKVTIHFLSNFSELISQL